MKKRTTQEFIKEANRIHNHKFDYSKVKYINAHTKIKIICPIHGEFEQFPTAHISGKCQCKQCSISVGWDKRRRQTEEFIEEAKKIHGNKYDYSLVEYTNRLAKVKIICPLHGEFQQTLGSHLRGRGCQSCNSSKGELLIKMILEDNNIKFEPQKTFDDCRGKKNKLPFDFYLPCYNAIIEFDGRQHFEEVNRWGHHKLEITQERDAIKNNYCKSNNISLIRIRYDEDIEQRVIKLLESLKVA